MDDGWCRGANRSVGVYFNCFNQRPDWCPLRPLPEKHGRLIDADVLEAQGYALSKMHIDLDPNRIPYVWREAIPFDEAQTIVEAEGEDDG